MAQPSGTVQASLLCRPCILMREHPRKSILVAIAIIAGTLAIASLAPGGLHFPVAATYALGAVAIASLLATAAGSILCKKQTPREFPVVFGRKEYTARGNGLYISSAEYQAMGADPVLPLGFNKKALKETELLTRIPKSLVINRQSTEFLGLGLNWVEDIVGGSSLSFSQEQNSEWVVINTKLIQPETEGTLSSPFYDKNNQEKVQQALAIYRETVTFYDSNFQSANLLEALTFLAIKKEDSNKSIFCEGLTPEQPLKVTRHNGILYIQRSEDFFPGALAVRRFPKS